MTQQRKDEQTCDHCVSLEHTTGCIDLCDEPKSDHYQHLITAKHPRCHLYMRVVDSLDEFIHTYAGDTT